MILHHQCEQCVVPGGGQREAACRVYGCSLNAPAGMATDVHEASTAKDRSGQEEKVGHTEVSRRGASPFQATITW